MRGLNVVLIYTLLALGVSFGLTQKEIMQRYCSVPPYVEIASKPNIIIVMDYSGSMQLPAHFSCGWDSFGGTRVAACDDTNTDYETKNYDQTDSNGNYIWYYGYFNPRKYYRYNSTGGYWEENNSCTYTDNVGGADCVSGSLLNWISMSRYDVALKALTGGKAEFKDEPPIGQTGSEDFYLLKPRGAYRRIQENTLGCRFYIRPNNYLSINTASELNNNDMQITISNVSDTNKCKVGEIIDAWLRVKVSVDEKKGILQKNADIADYALIVYSASGISEFNRRGEIRFGFHEYRAKDPLDAMDDLASRLENEVPWGATPTGPALCETIDYIAQDDSYGGDNCTSNYESNTGYINKGSEVDPFWDTKFGELSPCKQNVVILISDGYWNNGNDPDRTARYMHINDLRSDLGGRQSVDIFTLFAFSNSGNGKNSMQTVAAAGSFLDEDGDNNPYDVNVSSDSRDISFPRPNCDPDGTYDNRCKEWDKDKDGIPDYFYSAESGEEFEKALADILASIVKYNYSGGSLGVLAERSKGGNLVAKYRGLVIGQALFYTRKNGVDWTGKLFGYWLYLQDLTLREDSDNNFILNKTKDKILEFKLNDKLELNIDVFNVTDYGEKDTLFNTYKDPEDVNYLFEFGEELWKTDASNRVIYFPDLNCDVNTNPTCLKEFSSTNADEFVKNEGGYTLALLGLPDPCIPQSASDTVCTNWQSATSGVDMFNSLIDTCLNSNNDYSTMIDYIRGVDPGNGLRSKTVNTKTWKLGDIMFSTPIFVQYPNTSVVYVGANDGMLHAFEVGSLTTENIDFLSGDIVKLVTNDNTGKELWAFVPYNLVPYLRFLSDNFYCHLYYVDLTPYLYKDGNRLYLIGGYRLGAATGGTGSSDVNPPFWSCPSEGVNDLKDICANTCNLTTECSNFDSLNNSPCYGLSGYFMLDITDPKDPIFMWEFTDPKLGFAYSGPGIIKKSNNTYVMFASGPTDHKGGSTQNLTIFILDLYTGSLTRTIDTFTSSQAGSGTGSQINNAFGGRLFTEGIDIDGDGYTDYIAFGYAEQSGSQWGGGLIFGDVRDSDPKKWKFTKYFESENAPITAKVESMKCFNNYYLFFGSGNGSQSLMITLRASKTIYTVWH